MLKRVAALLFDFGGSQELRRARYKAMARQIPLMNFLIVSNILTLAYTHFGFVPKFLSVGFPAAVCLFLGYRTIFILRTNVDALDDTAIVQRLKTVVILSFGVTAAMAIWSYALFQYGFPFTQMHVVLFLCLTSIGAINCIMHIRQSSILISTVIVGSTIAFLVSSDVLVFNMIAVNMMVVTTAMLFTNFGYARDFANLVERGRVLREQSKRLKELNAENMRLANADSLTELPNRRRFFTELNALVEERATTDVPFAIGILDLDGFKPVNDVFGHTAGDELLAETADRLRALLPPDIILARLGGDEFGIIVPGFEADKAVSELGDEMCAALRVPFNVREGNARVSATIGFAVFPDAGQTAEMLFERADYALCFAKQHNKGSVVMFSEEHERSIREVSTIIHGLREADLEDELYVMFQPIIDITTGATISFEALGRWDSPTLGSIAPNIFIRSAEQEGIISKVTSILFAKALKAAAEWPEHIRLSFNLSVYDLCSMVSVQRLVSQISKSGIAFSRVTFEITETAIMQDFERANEALTMLRAMGIKIALDDFGTGFSSLSYVRRLPVDRLKIDRSFIAEIEESKAARDVLRTMVVLCKNLDLDCVVEGVETQSQLDIIKDTGGRLVQGYLYSKPVNRRDAKAFLELHRSEETAGAA
ncbi:MAG: EAL domain-containing protein [Rhodobiaceae bacterium]|nr:EAL domain-containing protein [Rhodobiaceae bacterium]MCC0049613.1 EAL domain-containing protein [Rhodobiaceae bacterium]